MMPGASAMYQKQIAQIAGPEEALGIRLEPVAGDALAAGARPFIVLPAGCAGRSSSSTAVV